jgi:hypothetical protein
MKLSTRRVFTVGAALGIMLGSVALTQASMAATTPTGPDSGDLSTSPSTFFVGDTITITANFSDNQSGKVITFYRETPAGSGQYDSIGTKTANSSGNGSLTGYTINAKQKVFARTSAGKETEVDTLTPKTLAGDDGLISACVDKDDGELSILLSTACSSSEKLLTWNQQGEKGEKGDKGDQGPPGPTQAIEVQDPTPPGTQIDGGPHQVLAKQLEAGKYVVTARLNLYNPTTDEDRRITCTLNGLGSSDTPIITAVRRNGVPEGSGSLLVFSETLVLMDAFATSEAGELQVACTTDTGHVVTVVDAKMIVTKVDSITSTTMP